MIMIISQKTIEKLRELINEETEYRSGSKLVRGAERNVYDEMLDDCPLSR